MGKQVDKNDFWFIEKNPITKVGVYPYLGKQISQDCEPDKIYWVLRPKEELFRKETLDSLRLIPNRFYPVHSLGLSVCLDKDIHLP